MKTTWNIIHKEKGNLINENDVYSEKPIGKSLGAQHRDMPDFC
jgi:hypothetical protein